MNKVIAGDFKGKSVCAPVSGDPYILISVIKTQKINKETVESIEVVKETEKISSTSAMRRSSVFGGKSAGYAAALGAKKKGTHLLSITFRDGKRSLIEIDDRLEKRITISTY